MAGRTTEENNTGITHYIQNKHTITNYSKSCEGTIRWGPASDHRSREGLCEVTLKLSIRKSQLFALMSSECATSEPALMTYYSSSQVRKGFQTSSLKQLKCATSSNPQSKDNSWSPSLKLTIIIQIYI